MVTDDGAVIVQVGGVGVGLGDGDGVGVGLGVGDALTVMVTGADSLIRLLLSKQRATWV